MSLPYRIIEILTVLKENPGGLKCKEILSACKSNPGSEIANEQNVYNLLYSMRGNSPLLIKKIEGAGGVTYFITPHGEQILAQEISESAPSERYIEPEDHSDYSPNQLEQISEQIAVVKFDTRDTLDKALHGLVQLIRTVASTAPAIENKQQKIAVLEQIENNSLLNPAIRSLLTDIKSDIDQMEDAV